jgi:hypothetical protein
VTRSFTLTLAAALLLSTSGCNWGTRPQDLPVATSAAGARIAVRVSGERKDRLGELLAVSTEGLYLRDARLTYISWAQVAAIDVYKLDGDFDLRTSSAVTEEYKQRLALVSRFRVLPPDLLQRVLREMEQDSLDVVQ